MEQIVDNMIITGDIGEVYAHFEHFFGNNGTAKAYFDEGGVMELPTLSADMVDLVRMYL